MFTPDSGQESYIVINISGIHNPGMAFLELGSRSSSGIQHDGTFTECPLKSLHFYGVSPMLLSQQHETQLDDPAKFLFFESYT